MADWTTFFIVVIGQSAVASLLLVFGIWWPQTESASGPRHARGRHRARHPQRNQILVGELLVGRVELPYDYQAFRRSDPQS